MKKILIFVCWFGFFLGSLVAQEEVSVQERMQEMGLSSDQISRLLSGQTLTDLSPREKTEFSLFVKNASLSSRVIAAMNRLRPKLSVESLVYLPDRERADRLDLFNAMLRLSSLSNLQYYQPVDRRTAQLVSGASTIDSPSAASGRPDHLLSSRPDMFTAYLRQTDDVFGLVNYQVDYYSNLDDVAMVIANLDVMKTKINPFPFAQRGGYNLVLQYVPLYPAKGSLLYTAVLAKEDPITFSRETLIKTLASYLDAYREWFVKNYPK